MSSLMGMLTRILRRCPGWLSGTWLLLVFAWWAVLAAYPLLAFGVWWWLVTRFFAAGLGFGLLCLAWAAVEG